MQYTRRVFDILARVHPVSKTKNDLGIEADMYPTSGSFGTCLSLLKSNGLIEVTESEIKASDTYLLRRNKMVRIPCDLYTPPDNDSLP